MEITAADLAQEAKISKTAAAKAISAFRNRMYLQTSKDIASGSGVAYTPGSPANPWTGGSAPKTPSIAPDPGAAGKGGGCKLEHQGFPGIEAFPLIGRIDLAAGAQAAGSDLGDFHDAANSVQISSNNAIPDGIRVYEAMLIIGVSPATGTHAENLAALMNMFLIERVSGVEQNRFPLYKFGLIVESAGVLTNGGWSSNVVVPTNGVEWNRFYDPDTSHELALQNNKAFTSVGAMSLTLIEFGVRGAK